MYIQIHTQTEILFRVNAYMTKIEPQTFSLMFSTNKMTKIEKNYAPYHCPLAGAIFLCA